LSEVTRTIYLVPRRTARTEPLRSATGAPLTREVTFKFALDPTQVQERALFAHAGAARFAFNHHLARIKANLDQREAEKSYGMTGDELTASLSWSKFSFINEFNAWKNGQLDTSPINGDGTLGLPWRGEVSQDVFECASVNAAQALGNFSDARTGRRAGKAVGFPKFKSRHKSVPSFRLRNRAKAGSAQQSGSLVRRRCGCRRSGSCASTGAPARCAACSRAGVCTCTPRQSGSSVAAGT
jgi:hypothetical protein